VSARGREPFLALLLTTLGVYEDRTSRSLAAAFCSVKRTQVCPAPWLLLLTLPAGWRQTKSVYQFSGRGGWGEVGRVHRWDGGVELSSCGNQQWFMCMHTDWHVVPTTQPRSTIPEARNVVRCHGDCIWRKTSVVSSDAAASE